MLQKVLKSDFDLDDKEGSENLKMKYRRIYSKKSHVKHFKTSLYFWRLIYSRLKALIIIRKQGNSVPYKMTARSHVLKPVKTYLEMESLTRPAVFSRNCSLFFRSMVHGLLGEKLIFYEYCQNWVDSWIVALLMNSSLYFSLIEPLARSCDSTPLDLLLWKYSK